MAHDEASFRHEYGSEIENVFDLIANLNEKSDNQGISKNRLVQAHGGEFNSFDKVNSDDEDFVSLKDFQEFLEDGYEINGDEWMRNLLHTLRSGSTGPDEAAEKDSETHD